MDAESSVDEREEGSRAAILEGCSGLGQMLVGSYEFHVSISTPVELSCRRQ